MSRLPYDAEGLRLLAAMNPRGAARACAKLLATRSKARADAVLGLVVEAGLNPWLIAMERGCPAERLTPLGVNRDMLEAVHVLWCLNRHGFEVDIAAALRGLGPGVEVALEAVETLPPVPVFHSSAAMAEHANARRVRRRVDQGPHTAVEGVGNG